MTLWGVSNSDISGSTSTPLRTRRNRGVKRRKHSGLRTRVFYHCLNGTGNNKVSFDKTKEVSVELFRSSSFRLKGKKEIRRTTRRRGSTVRVNRSRQRQKNKKSYEKKVGTDF